MPVLLLDPCGNNSCQVITIKTIRMIIMVTIIIIVVIIITIIIQK